MLKFLPSSITDAGTWWEIYPRTNQHHRRHGRGVQVYCRQLYLYIRVYLIQNSSKNTIFSSKNPETVRSCTMYSRYRNIIKLGGWTEPIMRLMKLEAFFTRGKLGASNQTPSLRYPVILKTEGLTGKYLVYKLILQTPSWSGSKFWRTLRISASQLMQACHN